MLRGVRGLQGDQVRRESVAREPCGEWAKEGANKVPNAKEQRGETRRKGWEKTQGGGIGEKEKRRGDEGTRLEEERVFDTEAPQA